MASVKRNTTITEYQNFVKDVYGLSNDKYFSLEDMLTQIQRFAMRGLKGIRKNNKEKIKLNMLISFSWFISLLNQLYIELEKEVWSRFPYVCSYCAFCPCKCDKENPKVRQKPSENTEKKPTTMEQFQQMFNEIYPARQRTLEDAGIHLAEEIGEFSETILCYRGQRRDADFEKICMESADLFSCFAGVFNSMNINITEEISNMFSENCHACKKIPCACSFSDIMGFNS